jgi:serine/threonine protein kinase/Tol biopolymer transport system component
MATTCPKCRFENPDDTNFCGKCATPLPGASGKTPEAATKNIGRISGELTTGALIAAKYRILAKLGAGGMGEVYRAEDLSLNRQVAIKVLPDIFAEDPERLARFQREAKVLASLNHPNIAAIHGVEEADGERFLVLELVEGETLAERLSKGPLSLEEALDVCRQIAEGLEGAHEKSIIHRDLKPSNVKITPERKVKILDFGLARAFHDQISDVDIIKSPTITADMTQPGVILGTAAYMSPEQAKGKTVDKRTDIWSFGCILYECLTGKRAFVGETVTETVAAILKSDPDYTLLPPETRPLVSLVLRQCLQKDPSLRLRDIVDVRLELRDLLAVAPFEAVPVAISRRLATSRRLLWGLAVLAVAAVALAAWVVLQPHPAPPLLRVNLEARITDVFSASPPFAVSPDGSRMVYVSESQNEQVLFYRRLDQFEATPLAGTEDARNPFFSPDGHTVGFFSRGRLLKVPVSGGSPNVICKVPTDYGSGTWGPDDTIVFATLFTGTGLFLVPAAGGKAEILTSPRRDQGETDHISPRFLPGGRQILFTVNSPSSSRTAIFTLKTREWKTLDIPGNAHYITTGHLIYYDSGKLFAQRFDLAVMTFVSSPVVVVGGVYRPYEPQASAYIDISDTGNLVYLPSGTSRQSLELAWINKTGEATPIPTEGEIEERPRLSPDGRIVAIAQASGTERAIFLYDLERGGRRKLTSSRSAAAPVWSPDGQRIAFSNTDSSGVNLFWIRVEAAGGAELLFASQYPKWITDISRDGRYLAYYELNPQTGRDIWILPLQGEKKPYPFLATPSNERSAVFSPDGNWIAYASDESGRDEVYVQQFPRSPKGSKAVSTHGGREPVWSPDGKELYYRRRSQLVAVPIKTSPTFMPGQGRVLFEGSFAEEIGGRNQNYCVSPDNQRFLIVRQGAGTTPQSLRVVFNWFEELKRLVPTGKK